MSTRTNHHAQRLSVSRVRRDRSTLPAPSTGMLRFYEHAPRSGSGDLVEAEHRLFPDLLVLVYAFLRCISSCFQRIHGEGTPRSSKNPRSTTSNPFCRQQVQSVGLLARFSVLVLDEVQTLKFARPEEVAGGLRLIAGEESQRWDGLFAWAIGCR